MSQASLLVELLTEELPPKALRRLGEEFALKILDGLTVAGLVDSGINVIYYATPRRLAVQVPNVRARGHDVEREIQGPSTTAPAQAVAGFAKKSGVAVEALKTAKGPKGEIFVAHVVIKGKALDDTLASIVEAALKALPIPKVMRWGSGEAQFVRPVHGLVLLHGTKVVPGEVLGLRSGNRTRGHRFMGKGEIALASADGYEKQLLDEGKVLADLGKRKAEIDGQLQAEAKKRNAGLGEYQDLLDEVAALVEFPSVYAGEFDRTFLAVPQECLILTMRQNQKYFPLFDAAGRLTGEFLIVSNMRVADPKHIIGGNQRVVRPRLEDARFFYDQDRKTRLEERVPRLAKVVYHNKLGSQLERVERIQLLAGRIARRLGADAALAERAAWLAKADLLTGMVGEFPELQGVMGRYYALHDQEPAAVADAIEAHYRPRFAGDRLPEGGVACSVALADKLDAIAGLFSAGQQPTGDKDPFGLRRAALGIVRILVENRLYLSPQELAKAAFAPFGKRAEIELQRFVYERFASYLRELGYSTLQIESVLSKSPTNLSVVPRQLDAVKAFQLLPEAESLAAANKRVANILKQAASEGALATRPNRSDLKEPAEIALYDALEAAALGADAQYERGDYAGFLRSFAVMKQPVDLFFDKVMVMAEDETLRRNRLALLNDLREKMNRVADLSRLAI